MTSKEVKTFCVLDVAAIYSGVLLKEHGMSSMQSAMGEMAGRLVWTHSLPDVARKLRPFIKEQFPEIESISFSNVDESNVDEFVAMLLFQLGENVDLSIPMLPDERG